MNRFDCHEALSALLDEWLQPSLGAARRQEVQSEVERLIAACPDGEREWRGLLEMGLALRELPPILVPPRVRSNISAALHAGPARRARSWSIGSVAWIGSASLAALALWLIAGPANLNINPTSNPPVSDTAASAPPSDASNSATAPLVMPQKPRNPGQTGGAQSQTSAGTASEGSSKESKLSLGQTGGRQSRAASGTVSERGQVKSGGTRAAKLGAKSDSQVNHSASEREADSARRNPSPGSSGVLAPPRVASSPSASAGKHNGAVTTRPRFSSAGASTVEPPLAHSIEGALKARSKSAESGPRSDVSASSFSLPPRLAKRQGEVKNSLPLRLGTPKQKSGANDLLRDFKTEWGQSAVTFTVVTLPPNTGTIVAPAEADQAPLPRSGANSGQESFAMPQSPIPGTRDGEKGRGAPIPSVAMEAAPVAPSVSAPMQRGAARAPKVGGISEGGTSGNRMPPGAAPPAPALKPPVPGSALPPVVSPLSPDIDASKRLAPKVMTKAFAVPVYRRFRVTIQAPRFLGAARARLEGNRANLAQEAPVWQGVLEAQKTVTFDVDAAVAPGDRLNLVLEQIRPTGESGEHKVFPLVRP